MTQKINMIKYAIWDQTSMISNRFLRQHLRDSFDALEEMISMVHHDAEYIIDYIAENSDCTHLVITQSGHTLRHPKNFEEAVTEFCEQDFLVAGQIIYHVNTYPFLHPQMIILNMEQYNRIGRPMIGYHDDSDVLDLHRPERSPENEHDDYTPLWLRPSGEIVACVRREFGWNIIHEGLNHGMEIRNLSDKIRWSKRFLYPNVKPHAFAECLKNRKVIPSLNYNQRQYIEELLKTSS